MIHSIIKVFLIILFSVSCLQCSSKERNFKDNSHPDEINTPKSYDLSDFLTIENDYNLSKTGKNILDKLNGVQEKFVLGTLYAKHEEMFNRIEDIVVDSNNRIYILDSRKYQVGVFDSLGKFIKTLGNKGSGPGEFMQSESLALYNDNYLLVNNLDRIEIFDISGDINYYKSIPLQRISRNICIIDDVLFVHSSQYPSQNSSIPDSMFYTIDAYSLKDFTYTFSFGKSYIHEDPHIVESLSRGKISCNEHSSTVQFVFDMMPFIYGYDSQNGDIKWISMINEFNNPKIEEVNRNNGRKALSFGRNENGMTDYLFRPVNISDSYQLLQFSRTISNGDTDENMSTRRIFHSFLINSINGKAEYIGSDVPFIIATHNEILASRDLSSSVPQARIYTFKE